MTDRGTNCDQTFDGWGRLCEVEVDSSTVATYAYDGLGQKAKRTDSPTLDDTYYFYSPEGQVLEELKVTGGDRIHSYVWGTQNIDDIVMRIGDGANSEEYYVLGANNNVITRLDYQGDILERYVYDGYGMPLPLSDDWAGVAPVDEDLFLFTGRQYHADHAQYDFRARWQDPELGVFVTRDPIGPWGDRMAFGNGYLYAGGDPVNRSDPSGLRPDPDVFAHDFVGPLPPGARHAPPPGEAPPEVQLAVLVPAPVLIEVGAKVVVAALAIAAPLNSRADDDDPVDPEPGDCALVWSTYPLCSSLPAEYEYPNNGAALRALKQATRIKNLRLHNNEPTKGGPCPGVGTHYNVRSGGDPVGSITCCPCCEDTETGPEVSERCRVH